MSLEEKLELVNQCYADCLDNALRSHLEGNRLTAEGIKNVYRKEAAEFYGWEDEDEWDLLWSICDSRAALAAFAYA